MDNNTVSTCADCIKEQHCEYATPNKTICNRKEEVKNMWEKIKKIAAKIVAAAKAVFVWCWGAVKRPYGTALWVACINCCLCFILPNVPLLVAVAAVLLVIFNSILYIKYKNETDEGYGDS